MERICLIFEIERFQQSNIEQVEDTSTGWKLRNDKHIISSISVTDIVFDDYLGKWNYRAIPKVKTWSYFLTIP